LKDTMASKIREKRLEANRRWYTKHQKSALERKATAYKADPVKFNARSDAWQKANPLRAAELSRIGKQAKQEIAAGRPRPDSCEVCRRSSKRTLHFDHCHTTGNFRGWLCNGCNAALGHAKDDPNTLLKLAEYLRNGATRCPK
jgi:Recombination endonuclease VII